MKLDSVVVKVTLLTIFTIVSHVKMTSRQVGRHGNVRTFNYHFLLYYILKVAKQYLIKINKITQI